jgi:hypothetical protein
MHALMTLKKSDRGSLYIPQTRHSLRINIEQTASSMHPSQIVAWNRNIGWQLVKNSDKKMCFTKQLTVNSIQLRHQSRHLANSATILPDRSYYMHIATLIDFRG